jgi:hypothetical protein
MAFYIIILLLSSITSFCYSKSKDVFAGRLFKIITFLLLFVPMALRHGIGADYNAYKIIFHDIGAGINSHVESGYRYINYLIYSLGGNFQLVIVFTSFFTLFFFFEAFEKKYFYLYVPLLVMVLYLWLYTTIRQMLAASMVYYAYKKFYLNKKYIKFFLLTFLGTTFHTVAWLYFIIPVLFLIKINRLRAYIIFFIFLFTLPFIDKIAHFIFNSLVSQTRFAVYLTISQYWNSSAGISSGLVVLLRFILYTILLFSCVNNNKKEESQTLVLFLFMILFDCFTLKVPILARISRGFLFSYFLIIKEIMSGKSRYRSVITILACFLIFLMFFAVLLTGGNYSVPYRSILGEI